MKAKFHDFKSWEYVKKEPRSFVLNKYGSRLLRRDGQHGWFYCHRFWDSKWASGECVCCSVSFFENGSILNKYDWLIRPPGGLDYFNPFNTRLHGISSRDVADKPQFNELWPEVYSLINNKILAAHNASFDVRFWASCWIFIILNIRI